MQDPHVSLHLVRNWLTSLQEGAKSGQSGHLGVRFDVEDSLSRDVPKINQSVCIRSVILKNASLLNEQTISRGQADFCYP